MPKFLHSLRFTWLILGLLLCATNSVADEFKSIPLGTYIDFCSDFKNASVDGNIQSLLHRIEDGGYSHEEVFSRVECMPERLNNAKNRIPMIQIAVESIDSRDKFPKEIYDYFQAIKQNGSWLKVINAKNTKGMTFMDYIKFVHEKQRDDSSENLKNKFRAMFAFACSHGGNMSYYKDYDCSKGLDQVGVVAK